MTGSLPSGLGPTPWIAFGYDPGTFGPRLPAEGLAMFDLVQGPAVNLSVSFLWGEEPISFLFN